MIRRSLFVTAAMFLLSSACAMAQDICIKIKDVVATSGLQDCDIVLYSYSFGASNSVTIASGTGGISTGKPDITSFTLLKSVDLASVALKRALVAGSHFGEATVTLFDPSRRVVSEFKFEDVVVESQQESGSNGSGVPVESVSLKFAKFTWTATAYDPNNPNATPKKVQMSWDLTKVAP